MSHRLFSLYMELAIEVHSAELVLAEELAQNFQQLFYHLHERTVLFMTVFRLQFSAGHPLGLPVSRK